VNDREDRVEVRVHGAASLPTLIYLPGLHGDWTLIGGFRKAVAGQARFVELTYPRTLTWSLEDYAAGIEEALRENGITKGWLIGESYGSQLAWPLASRKRMRIQGIVLAGGFASHPTRWFVRAGAYVCGGLPLSLLTRVLFGYSRVARFRFLNNPETLKAIHEFVARRTELDRQAAKHRLNLIAANDPGELVRELDVPVFGLAGMFDPIVPWFFVRRWLQRHCASLREYRVIPRADHNVLSTAYKESAKQILSWVSGV